MLPLKPPAFGKSIFVIQQKVLFCFVFGLFAIAFVGCNGSGGSQDTKAANDTPANAVKAPLQQHVLFDNLHVLYVERNALKSVLDKLKGNKERLVLEYFRDQNDVLRLITWNAIYASPNDSADFKDKLVTEVSTQTTPFNLSGKNIIMGVIEIGGTSVHSNLYTLKKAVNASQDKYILFEPKTEEHGTDTLLIKYRIWSSNTTLIDSTKDEKGKFLSSVPILLSPNPSPPAKAY